MATTLYGNQLLGGEIDVALASGSEGQEAVKG